MSVSTRFWSTTMPINLCIVHSFHHTMAKLTSPYRKQMAHKYLLSNHLQKKCANPLLYTKLNT